MRIGFMVSRRYFHYKKWFGTLFKRLPLASALEPVLLEIAEEQRWQRVEEKIGQAASLLVQEQNRLGIAPAMAWNVEADDGRRHHLKLDFWGISGQLATHLQPPLKSLMDNQVFWLHERSLVLWNEEAGKWPLLLQA
jgi:hypothetical protein